MLIDLIAARHSKRAFLGEPAPRGVMESVLVAAANAPSGKNTQPWRVEIVEGETLAALSRKLCARFDVDTPPRRTTLIILILNRRNLLSVPVPVGMQYSPTKALIVMIVWRVANILERTFFSLTRPSYAFFICPSLPNAAISLIWACSCKTSCSG